MHNLLNEFTDLSERLEHLVSYSSQMVFISGDQMGDQQKFVEAFLGAKQSDVDIVYLTGNSFHSEEDVRHEFARQVVGNSPSIDLPLLQLVATREQRNTPLLIAVTRAERIPDQILQELWDLVLQTRFARNHQQINIILFGEQEWAERTKSWLPTNNNDKPVLLTSETVEMKAEQEIEGDLDAFIKSKRKEFNERLKARALAYDPPASVLTNWWVKLLAICTFIICFSGLLIWQYFDLTQSAFKDFAQFLFQTEASSPAQEWEEAKALLAETDSTTQKAQEETNQKTQTEDNSLTEEANTGFVSNWKEESERLARKVIPVNLPETPVQKAPDASSAKTIKQPETINTNSGGLELSQAESIVDIPKSRLKQLQDNTAKNEPTVIAEPLIPNELAGRMAKADTSNVEFVGPPLPENLNSSSQQQADSTQETSPSPQPEIADVTTANELSETLSENSTEVEDYRIEDIVSVEELERQTETPPAPSYLFNERNLLDLKESQYLLQVSGMSSQSVLEQYLADNRLQDRVWVYKTQRYGGNWFVVVYNKAFNSLDEARSSVSELPQTTRQSAPFAKSITTVKQEIAQGYPEK
ncbi:SPOR domain-containing protein [Alteromonas sp. a30]|uniref:SPOR domain-containing protein n=1 Tax=Alteromonas sp. a30 TaxID=2730917 RepID=UPI002282092C|nr:hypothetical protein [Alteromonas sp. a30]MCY7295304.1 hypothetical protein [Alteromonas sp. a30]